MSQELEARISELEGERDELQGKVEELTPLSECGVESRKHMRGEAIEAFKVSRGESVKEADIEAFSNRAEKLTYLELVGERDYLRTLAPSVPEVEPGSSTSQPDESGNREGGVGETAVRGVNPPHWHR